MQPAKRRALKALTAASLAALCPELLFAQTAQTSSGPGAKPQQPAPQPVAKPKPPAPPIQTLQPRTPGCPPVSILMPRGWTPPAPGGAYPAQLAVATLDFIRTLFAGKVLPIWERPFEAVDLAPRVSACAALAARACAEMAAGTAGKASYPLDPAWIMAMILAESCFNEFAVSSSLAVGVCQFIPETARQYGMLTAGDRPEHGQPPFKLHQLAGRAADYFAFRSRKKEASRAALGGRSASERLREALEALVAGRPMPEAGQYLQGLIESDRIEEEMKAARTDYKRFVTVNLLGRDVFRAEDLAFLATFDERATLEKPVRAMVQLVSKSLNARSGNILAATAAYNAGLGNTQATGFYEAYGTLPNFAETVTYVSRIFINYHEIAARL